MNIDIIEFGKRMDVADDKQLIVDAACHATSVLDLGAGTGKISRAIAERYNIQVDAVDLQFKDICEDSSNVHYHGISINEFLDKTNKKYDFIILSAILHELSDDYIAEMLDKLSKVMEPACRIVVREPFYDDVLGPVAPKDRNAFIKYVENRLPAGKVIEFATTVKLSSQRSLGIAAFSYLDWLNMCFTLSYGEQSWEREKHELRYARSLNWCKETFNMSQNPFLRFEVTPILDSSYQKHFKGIGIPEEAFHLIRYTGMIITIDYAK